MWRLGILFFSGAGRLQISLGSRPVLVGRFVKLGSGRVHSGWLVFHDMTWVGWLGFFFFFFFRGFYYLRFIYLLCPARKDK